MTEHNPYNTLVIGKAGEGMSFFVNEAVRQHIPASGTTVIIDRGQSHEKLLRSLQGQATQPAERAWYRRFAK